MWDLSMDICAHALGLKSFPPISLLGPDSTLPLLF